jgi:signal transduction histidine kinase/ligand-binding sensor domain-containing protein
VLIIDNSIARRPRADEIDMSRTKPGSRPATAIVALGTAVLLLWPTSARALDPSLDISQYAHLAWTFRNGFSNGAVYAIAQTPDGYLWLGTSSGVVRYDGARLTRLPLRPGQQLPNIASGALLPARDGTVWIGTLDGLVSWKNGTLTEYPVFARRTVITLLQHRDGTVWAGSFGGSTGKLCAFRGEQTACYGDDGKLGASVASLYEDSDGTLWVGAGTGLWRWTPDSPTRHLATPIQSHQSLTQGDHGRGVLVAVDRVRQVAGTGVIDYPLRGVPSPLTATSVLRDRNGGLWIGTAAHGLVHSYEGKTSLFGRDDGLSSDEVLALFEDREGTIWVGTSDGLDRFREWPVTPLSVKQGLSNSNATSVLASRDGSIWIGTANGLNRWREGRTTIYRRRTNPGLPDDSIQSLFEDERGRIWVSGSRGLAAFENGKFTAVPAVPGGFTHAIATDNRGGLWLSLWLTSNDYGLVRLVDGEIIEQAPWEKLGGGPGTGLVPDPDGGVWTGLLSGGVAHFRSGQIRNMSLTDEGASTTRKVLDVSRDRHGTMWVATDDGLSRIADGRVATLGTANGLPCKTVHWIIEDQVGSYWLYTACGLVRISRSELDAWAADPKRIVRSTTFDSADGIQLVPILRPSRPSVTKSSDGRIWFVNGTTVSFIDPSHIGINTLPPPVHIEQVVADGQTFDKAPGLRLPPNVRDLHINYTANSMVVPEKVHFRYQLESQDVGWRQAVNKREVQYSNLPPGDYRFRVSASNNSGVWNDEGDVLDFSIAPAYYQTNWFRAVGVGLFVALLWAAYQVRMRQVQHAFALSLEARVGERTRIARELHDTLLQSFQALLLRLQTASYLLSERPAEGKETLDGAIQQTAQAITEGREAVQGLRASTIERNDLAVAIRTLGEELAMDATSHKPTTFSVDVGGEPRDLHPIVRDEIYRIAAEALRNAFRHAHAERVEVDIRYDNDQFRLCVRDDGQGFDSTVLDKQGLQGHYGLRGMPERAALIGGTLAVWSEVGAGTEVELSLPARAMYSTSATRSWWPRLFASRARARARRAHVNGDAR